ncbi:MAG: hypothetical protein AB8G14_18975 [Ilumatobacter sp.]
MTLRGVIQGLMRGSDDAEAALADEGYGDLPAEIFGQALSSYADTATMEEADALSPVLTTLDAGDASDVFAVLQEQPLTLEPTTDPASLAAVGLGAAALDDTALDDTALGLDDFGAAAPEDVDDAVEDALEDQTTITDEADDLEDFGATEANDPFTADEISEIDDVVDAAGEFVEQEEFFDTEPVATGEDPSDLDF